MRTLPTAAGRAVALGGAGLLLLVAATQAGALAPAGTASGAHATPAPAGVRYVVQEQGADGPVFRSVPAGSRGARAVTDGDRDVRVHAIGTSLRAQQWALNRVQFEQAWTVTRGAGVVVGVVDSGVDGSLPALRHRVLPGHTFQGAGFVDRAGQTDLAGHGTHVAGIVAADGSAGSVEGGAPGARVLPVSVLDENGDGWSSDVANGIVWAVDHGARVLNLSFGTSSPSVAVRTAVAYAQDKGAVVVAAAGNSGPDGPYEYPVAYPGVIGVGAVDPGDKVAPFSTTGPVVDLSAPGESVLSTVPKKLDKTGVARLSGTSMASPYVAAAAALVRAANPSLSVAQVSDRLTSTAEDLGAPGRDDAYGAGLVDPAAALGVAHAARPARLPAPTGLSLQVLPDGSVTLSWTGVPGAKSYAVLYEGLPLDIFAEEGLPPVYGLHGTNAHFPVFPRGLKVPLQVVAVDDLGLWSPPSETFAAFVEAKPIAAPTHVRATSPHSRTVRLSWSPVKDPGLTGYAILRDGAAYDEVDAHVTTFVDSPGRETFGDPDPPVDGRTYTYKVVAFSDAAMSDPSAAATARPYAYWPVPGPRLSVHRAGTTVHVGWSAAVRQQRGWRVFVDGRLARELPLAARGYDLRTPGRHVVTVTRFRTSADQSAHASVPVVVPAPQ